ncbi:ROK family transcriptional regulator [Blastococcus sp. VKM Ac-2987]|uniref:ROK family transcriptional regulator n=1 Tax=Blastococcus sp. VKM Ac-2987 TaxID=3004141 RepID=UPI0022AB7248|nr:ROK family transcriptional regulator [Blastococcus sp. VKM Ac-2987]MCZ2861105.1 ROK family transcriptional regulator [Blastococcus sp. VKM Ac-2987]
MAEVPPLYDGSAERRAPADQATVRRTNLGLVLRHLRDHGPRSRARIAQETGLNKATVSSLVAELADRRLVTTGDVDRAGSVGRPGLTVHLDGRGVCGIGVELNVDYVAVLVPNLRGEVLFEQRLALDIPSLGAEATLDAVAGVVTDAVAAATAVGACPAGLTVAVAGLVRSADGVVTLAPNIGWRDVAVLDGLRARLDVDFPIRVENDANLSAIAEWALGSEARTPDLVYLTGEVGVGGGVIVAGRLLRGAGGLSGEVGHTTLGDPDVVCGCGRRGCWETVVGLAALLRAAAEPGDPVSDPARDLETRLAEVAARAEAGDARTLAALHQVGRSLGTGAAVLINLFNPRVVILGGYFAVLGRFLMAPLLTELEARVLAPGVAGARVVLSTLGFTAAVRGGAHVALEPVLDDPTLVPVPVPELASSGAEVR